nr:hypothetical protein Iba_chr01aCG3440 [Ipomoea batatas]GMC77962.1 hypothetical protein Iba_chr03fCG3470 [Ipomoea batatas]
MNFKRNIGAQFRSFVEVDIKIEFSSSVPEIQEKEVLDCFLSAFPAAVDRRGRERGATSSPSDLKAENAAILASSAFSRTILRAPFLIFLATPNCILRCTDPFNRKAILAGMVVSSTISALTPKETRFWNLATKPSRSCQPSLSQKTATIDANLPALSCSP